MRFSSLTAVIIAAGLFTLSAPASAQSIDSFFDVFYDGDAAESAQCEACSSIELEIYETEKNIDALVTRMQIIDSALNMIDDAILYADEQLVDLEKELAEMNDPKNFVESDGRRYDSADHAALKRRNANLWKTYKRGGMTAEEYTEEIGKPFDDPSVAEDLEILKEIIKGEIEEHMDNFKHSIESAKNSRLELNKKGQDLGENLDVETAVLDELERILADCNKRCLKENMRIEDLDVPQDDWSFLDGFFDIFIDESAIPGLDEALEELRGSPWMPDDGEGDGTEEMPETSADSFFDIFIEVKLPPPVCHLCDPLRAQIEEDMAELNALKKEDTQLQAEHRQLLEDRARVQAFLSESKRALESFDNPNASAESEGRFIDSNDQAALRSRNARLWGEHRSGKLSAQELESEWAKPFDDPAVKKELEKIKKQMRHELEKAIAEAEDVMKDLDAAMKETTERLVELAGTIAGRQVLLDYLLKQLKECEKKCVTPVEDPTVALDGYEGFIFPRDSDDGEYSSSEATSSTSDDEDEDPEFEDETGCPSGTYLQESECQFTCKISCRVVDTLESGKSCYSCFDAKPESPACDSPAMEKQECYSECGDIGCDEAYIRANGDACYVCAEDDPHELGDGESIIGGSDQGFLCRIFKLFCPDAQSGSSNSAESRSSAGAALSSGTASDDAGISSAKASSAKTSVHASSQLSSVQSSSAKTSAKAECDEGTMTKSACEQSCGGTCYESYEEFDGLTCFTCRASQTSSVTAKVQCDPPTETETSCRKNCFGTCNKSYTRSDGVKCFECVSEAEGNETSSSTSRTVTGPTCPSGKVADKSVCESQCAAQGGTCVAENGCYSCTVVNCPSGTYKNECPTSCGNGCDVVGAESGVSCYQCKQSCEETCTKNGYGPESTDHSNAILADLQQYSCVTGASISIQTAKIGSCNCVGTYSLSVDQTKPVCKGTPCGDVLCGSSAQCGDGTTTITVSCNWQGWQKVQKHQFRPVFGQ